MRYYKHVPTEELKALYLSAVREHDHQVRSHYPEAAGDIRRHLKRYARELRKREKETP